MEESDFKIEDYITFKGACEILNISTSNLYNACKRNRFFRILVPIEWIQKNYTDEEWEVAKNKYNGRRKIFLIDIYDLGNYYKNRWNRKFSVYKGKPLYGEGEYSIKSVCKLIRVDPFFIYYRIYNKQVPAIQRGSAWILNDGCVETLKQMRRK